ncbi:MAG: hypothetical protein R3F00_12050 [Dokdonella sp.]
MVTPFSLSEGTARALRPAGALDLAGVAVVVSITDGLVFLVDWVAGFLAALLLTGAAFFAVFAAFADEAGAFLMAGFLVAATFLLAAFAGLVDLAGAFAFVAGAGFLRAGAAFLVAAARFAGAFGLATGFAFVLLAALGLAFAALATGFALALAAGFERTAALADLVPALDF